MQNENGGKPSTQLGFEAELFKTASQWRSANPGHKGNMAELTGRVSASSELVGATKPDQSARAFVKGGSGTDKDNE